MNGKVRIYKHPTSKNIYLDISYEGIRRRPSTNLKNTSKNMKMVEQNIIPEIERQITEGTFSFDKKASSSQILELFAVDFFEVFKKSVRENTYIENKANLEKKVFPYFKSRTLKSIKPIELEKWQNTLLEKYSDKSVAKFRYIFQKLFETAYKNDLIDSNPFKKVSAPKKKEESNIIGLGDETDGINPFNTSELKIMFANFKGYLGYFVYLMAFTGMRPSEIIALEWKDIDFQKNRIAVYKAIVKGRLGKPKTKNSSRYVDILPNLREKLIEWKSLCPSSEYLFVNQQKNRFYGVNIINNVFKKRLAKYNIKERYIYQLRHTFASMYITKMNEGVNILWVSKMLGHKDLSTTLGVYTKFIKEDELIRIDNLDKMAQIWHNEESKIHKSTTV